MYDNISLKYLFDQQNLNARQARWSAFLSEYDFEIKHIKRKENKVVDVLRRIAITNCIASNNNNIIQICILLKASTTLFSFPFICLISKSYSLRKSIHLSCPVFRFCWSNRYLDLCYQTLAEIFYLLSDGATFLEHGLWKPTLSHKLHNSFHEFFIFLIRMRLHDLLVSVLHTILRCMHQYIRWNLCLDLLFLEWVQ